MLWWKKKTVISINGFIILGKCHKSAQVILCVTYSKLYWLTYLCLWALLTHSKTKTGGKNLRIGWQKWEKCCSKGVKMQFTGFFLSSFDCSVEQLADRPINRFETSKSLWVDTDVGIYLVNAWLRYIWSVGSSHASIAFLYLRNSKWNENDGKILCIIIKPNAKIWIPKKISMEFMFWNWWIMIISYQKMNLYHFSAVLFSVQSFNSSKLCNNNFEPIQAPNYYIFFVCTL